MDALKSLAPWALVLAGAFLIMWAVNEVFEIKAPVWKSIMIICAALAGILLIATH